MACAFRFLLISMALLAASGTVSAGKGNPPAHKPPAPKPPPVHKPPLPKPHLPKMPLPKPPHLPVPHPVHGVPRHLSPPKVTHHPRPIVIHGPIHHVRRSAAPIVRQPIRRAAIRTIHRYPVHRLPFRFVRRLHYYYGVYGYSYYNYPGRYWWRTNHNRGSGAWQRRRPHVIGGIVESLQGIPGNGILLMKVFRPRSSRFR